ncbi:MAG: sugar ABC transporter ATP-binding protein [Thermotogaceae bacterium]|mgnify:CR=1 FL=1|jgi:ribose transport system ATP-binding protein|nr:sugar ABC transporter ATP-binding protein [Mesotoga sp.]MDI9375196.1 sugar ABC transporter ATP-binding protein [Thermotogota bacterium]NLX34090.1 sugar ABC transporter ATP-binding protein [Thermotogaceae bacterium]MDD4040617.1 sugar ABC transporter ATP-binding protein [Mesotoga sp.]MDD5745421.1 sugar ABC transporter ATP-binding protein [Mesotoga sp.]
MGEVLIKTSGIAKEFSGVRVLDDINIEIEKGEIFGIIGENGAGKSTLVKIFSGIYNPTKGKLFFEGREVEIKDPIHAKAIGISLIPQEFNLINELNVYENIFLGSELTGKGFLAKKDMKKRTRELLKELETTINPDEKIERLSVAQKQMVEIAKALAHDSKLLIMDEPTTVLTQNEIKILFDLMRRLKGRGVTIIYISHKLKEVKSICDRVMVLRDGIMISVTGTVELDEHEMAKRMVGRELSQVFPEKTEPSEEVVLEVKNLSVRGLLKDISFDLRRGEILGFAGLVGAGRTELAEAIIGIRKKEAGAMKVKGRTVEIKSPNDAVKNKIAYLSEDRQGSGILISFDIIGNTTLISLPAYSRILINHRLEREKTQKYVDKFNIRAASLKTRLEFFSGGNQQKVSLAKSLDPEPEIFIFDEPTRGIDVNAKREIYWFINELVKEGVSCIIISSELEEIIGMSNRVVVMKEGTLTGILEGEHINEEEIMLHATGLKGVA